MWLRFILIGGSLRKMFGLSVAKFKMSRVAPRDPKSDVNWVRYEPVRSESNIE
ncbi:hypothetical protein WN943_021094 [Citrus x changshan-huyou]